MKSMTSDLPPELDAAQGSDGVFEITLRVRGSKQANQVLSWIVRSTVYDVVENLTVGTLVREDPRHECA